MSLVIKTAVKEYDEDDVEDVEEDEEVEDVEEDEEEEDVEEIDDIEDDIENDIDDIEEDEEDEEEEEEDDVDDEELEVDDVEDEEEVEDKEDILEGEADDKEDFELRDLVPTETTVKRKRMKIQRYCKSTNEFNPRVDFNVKPTPYLFEKILSQCTTENNAKKFSEVCPHDRKSLYQLCGKFIQKDYNFGELYQEIKSGIHGWNSKTYKNEKEQEAREISVMTVKLSVSEGLYQCTRCKSKKTFSRQVQTRSADEGMTSIIQCSECNKVWREYA